MRWTSATCRLSSWLSRWLFCVVPMDRILPGATMAPIYKALCWSLKVLGSGEFPSEDHNGNRWPVGSRRAELAGTPLLPIRKDLAQGEGVSVNGYKFILCEVLGDWKWLMEEFLLEANYHSNETCWKCKGTKLHGNMCVYNFGRDAAWVACRRTHEEYMASVGETVPLTNLPGWHLSFLKGDLMHIALLGVCQWALGSCMWQLVLECHWAPRLPRGTWRERAAAQLSRAYFDFVLWCRLRGLQCSHPPFTVCSMSMHQKTSWPYLKGKAANTLTIAKWVLHLSRIRADHAPADMHKQLVATMLWGFVEVFRICGAAGTWLSDAEARALDVAREASLQGYGALAAEAAAAHPPRPMFRLVPKHHAWDEALRDAVGGGRNPGHHWCFGDEDFIGRVKRIAAGTHGTSMSRRVLQRYMCRIFEDAEDA